MSSYVLLSGGFDSATVLGSLHANALPVSTLFIDYGQPARNQERTAAASLARHYGAEHTEVAIDGLRPGEGEIRGRNLLLAAVALSAPSDTATIAFGVHAGSPYWDCTAEFIAIAQRLADGYTSGTVQVAAPMLDFTKADVYALGRDLGVPEGLTYSCERADGPCDQCSSCLDRIANARS